jgi:hypothetical protein
MRGARPFAPRAHPLPCDDHSLAPANLRGLTHTAPSAAFPSTQPFLWIDKRGRWHIINHAYSNVEYENCAASAVSAHFFSPDGKNWSFSPQPYGHTVSYDDGTEHTYVTLERPNLHFDASGQMTHLNLAADLVTGAEGCASRPDHAHNGRVLRHSPPNPVVRVAHLLLSAVCAPCRTRRARDRAC